MRHTEIVAHFGEYTVCNWLSRSGFVVSVVDHTGMDILACDPKKGRLGITVKSRNRKPGKENESVFIFSRKNKDREKLKSACTAFGCDPWIAVYVECTHYADLYLTSLDHYDSNYRKKNVVTDAWRMGNELRKQYASDPGVRHLHLTFDETKWNRLRGIRT